MLVKAIHTSKLIKERIKFLEISQTELSKRLGWESNNSQYISNILRGKCPFPTKSISDLANATGLDKAYIMQAMTNDYFEALNATVIKQTKD